MEAQRLAHWSHDVRGGVFAGLKFLVARVTRFGNPLPWAKAAATWNPLGLMLSRDTSTAGCGWLLALPKAFRQGNKIKWVQRKRKEIGSVRYFQALITWFFSHTITTSRQPKGGGLPRPGAEWLGDGKRRGVCRAGGWGEEEGEKGRKTDTGVWPAAKKNN